jgi:hypothetical protein
MATWENFLCCDGIILKSLNIVVKLLVGPCIKDFLFLCVQPLLGLLHHVDVGSVADVSKVHIASIFRVDMYRLVSPYVRDVSTK